jgi:hypothetical protein
VMKKITGQSVTCHTISMLFLCSIGHKPMKFCSLQMYCKIFHGFDHSTTQAYCCFSCCSAITETVIVTKKITGQSVTCYTISILFLCSIGHKPMKFCSLQMYCKIFHGFDHSTTQAYCCFPCCSAITETVIVMKKITGQSVMLHNKHVVSVFYRT